jgi:hypothetical protein
MWASILTEWASLILRWLHVLAAIGWIGSLFYFIHLDPHVGPAVMRTMWYLASLPVRAAGLPSLYPGRALRPA